MNRLLAYGIALAAVIAMVLGYGHVRYRAGVAAAEARMAADVAKANQNAAETEKTAQARLDLLEKQNAEKISGLDARLAAALARAPVIRVQKCPPSRRELPEAAADTPQRHDDASGDRPDTEDGGDIAPELLRYARDAESLRLAVLACQSYGREIELFRDKISDGSR